jgi:hypothetical protein
VKCAGEIPILHKPSDLQPTIIHWDETSLFIPRILGINKNIRSLCPPCLPAGVTPWWKEIIFLPKMEQYPCLVRGCKFLVKGLDNLHRSLYEFFVAGGSLAF